MIKGIIYSTLLFFILAFSQATQAQAKLVLSEVRQLSKRSIAEKLLGQDENFFYILRSSPEGSFFIEKYSQLNLTLEYSVDITLPQDNDDSFLEAYFIHGKTVVFREHFERNANNNDQRSVYMQTITANGIIKELRELLKIETPKMVMGVDLMGAKLGDASMHTINYDFNISDNKKHICIAASETITTTESHFEKCMVLILDAESLSHESKIIVPKQFTDSNIEAWNFKTDDDGDVLFNFNYNYSEKKTVSAIGIMSQRSDKITGIDLNFNRTIHKIEDIDFISKGDKIYCSIIYKNRVREKDGLNLTALFGLFSQTLNLKTLKPEKMDSVHFSEELINILKKGEKSIINNYRICSIIETEGKIYTIAEQDIRSALVVYQTSSSGEIKWVKPFPRFFKITTYFTKNFFLAIAHNGNLRLIYCESPANTDKAKLNSLTMKNNKATGYGDANVTLATISSDGSIKQEVIYKNTELSMIPIDGASRMRSHYNFPLEYNMIVPIENKGAILYFERGDRYAYGKLIY